MTGPGGKPAKCGPLTARQLPLDLGLEPRLGVDDFLVAPPNRPAWDMINRWPEWPSVLMILAGPPGSGKSHLGSIWAQKSNAQVLPLASLQLDQIPGLAAVKAVLLEDATPGAIPERQMFHLINALHETGGSLLITSRLDLGNWGIVTPDLLSRLRLAPALEIASPGDELVRAVLVKLFHDRQLKVEANVIEYIALRIERSLNAARQIVERLDREALSRGRAVTRPMAAGVLQQMDSEADE